MRARGIPVVWLVALSTCGGCDRGSAEDPEPGSAPGENPWFVDVTAELGLDFRVDRAVQRDYFMPESMAAGCALLDYDNDGDLDIYVVNGFRGPGGELRTPRGANRLYRQDAEGRFTDLTDEAGVGDRGYGMGVATGDIDNDGDVDLYVTNYGPDALYRNNGDGTYAEITARAGIKNDRWGASAGFFDYDGDGYLDLFVTNYLAYDPRVAGKDAAGRPEYAAPSMFRGVDDVLYHNQGDGTFRDVTAAAGISDSPGKGLGVFMPDLNGDGRFDVYVANDGEANFAWINQGDGTFVNQAFTAGCAVNGYGMPEASMGIAWGDCDNDGDLDFLLTHLVLETNTLYQMIAPGVFEDVTTVSGLGAATLNYTGFGTAFFDFDLDGDLDLLTVNGRVLRTLPHPKARVSAHWNPYAEPNQMFANDGRGRFEDISSSCGRLCSDVTVSRGLAVGDIDRDGDLDVLVTDGSGEARIYRNQTPSSGHWLIVRAIDPALRRDAVGAVVEVVAGGRRLRRDVSTTYSYLSAGDPRVHFGLGSSGTVDRIEVVWPDRSREVFTGPAVDRVVELVKGTGRPRA